MTWPGDPLKGRARRKWRRWKKVVTSLQVLLGCCVCSMTPPCDRPQTHKHTYAFRPQRCPTLCSITRLHRGAAVIPSWLRTAWVAMGRRNSSVTLSGSPYVSWNQAPPIMTWKTRSRAQEFFKTHKYLNFYAVKINTFWSGSDQTVDSRQQDGFTPNVSSLILKAFSFLINL